MGILWQTTVCAIYEQFLSLRTCVPIIMMQQCGGDGLGGLHLPMRLGQGLAEYYKNVLNRFLGAEKLEYLVSFYNGMLKRVKEDTLVVFLSRRGYELFITLVKSGLIERTSTDYISDR